MDYTVNVNGIDIVIEAHLAEDKEQVNFQQRKRLMVYYQKLLEMKGIEPNSERYDALNNIVSNMTEQSAKKKADSFEQARVNRLFAYATKFSELKLWQESFETADNITKEEVFKTEKMADALIEVLDATANDDLENQETVNINGNKFIYDKGSLNVRDYVQKLYDIGEQSKGNTWTIYIDDEGELVIY